MTNIIEILGAISIGLQGLRLGLDPCRDFPLRICRNNITICSGLGEFELSHSHQDSRTSRVTSEECRSSVATCET